MDETTVTELGRHASRRHAARPPRARPACALPVGTLLAAALLAGAAPAQQTSQFVPFDKAMELCQHFKEIVPPPPPVGRVVVGTFDALTGEFTWNPTVRMRPNGRQSPRDWVVDLGPVFDRYQIRSVVARLDPAITSLPTGLRLLTAANYRTVLRPGTEAGTSPGVRPRAASRDDGTQPGAEPLKGHPIDLLHSMYLPVEGGMQDLVFNVANLPKGAEFTVTIDGRTASSRTSTIPGAVDILVPAVRGVRFKLKSSGGIQPTIRVGAPGAGPRRSAEFEEEVMFDRPPVLGCFTLEALPLLIVYEPPGSGSSQEYTTVTRTGTVVKTFTATDSSTTRPVDTQFSTVSDFHGILKGAGEAFAALSVLNPAFGKVGTGLQTAGGILEALWGTSETNETVKTSVTTERTLVVEVEESSSMSTSAHLGPGRGDVIRFLRKPLFTWLAAVNPATGQLAVTVSLLSFQALAWHSAEDLRSGVVPAPSKAAQTLLLALDPLTPEAGQGYQTPDAERMVKLPYNTQFSGAGGAHTYARTVTESDVTTETTTRNITTTEAGGILGFIASTVPQLGLDVPQTGEASITTVHGGSSGMTVGTTVKVAVTLESPPGEYHEFETYYDRTFGTFAFKEVTPGPENLTGTVTAADGTPAARTKVELLTQSGTFITWTDVSGRYAFRSRALRPGDHVLVVGGRRRPLPFGGSSIRADVRLDAPLAAPEPKVPTRAPAVTVPPVRSRPPNESR